MLVKERYSVRGFVVAWYFILSFPSDVCSESYIHALTLNSSLNLTDYIARYGKMSERAARQKFWQILSAVEYCHKRGIVHRDLKVNVILMWLVIQTDTN